MKIDLLLRLKKFLNGKFGNSFVVVFSKKALHKIEIFVIF